MNPTQSKGFTLIELLIVITIIGILAVALIPRIVGGSADARDARRETDVSTISTALGYYLNKNGSFDSLAGTIGSFVFCSDNADFVSAVSDMVKSVPGDPLSDHQNAYLNSCIGSYEVYFLTDDSGVYTRYAVVAILESPSAGTEYVYESMYGEASDYETFVNELVGYSDDTGDQAGYYVVY